MICPMIHPGILVICALHVLNLGIVLAKHGQPQEGRHNVLHALSALVLIWALLWWAGAFGLTWGAA